LSNVAKFIKCILLCPANESCQICFGQLGQDTNLMFYVRCPYPCPCTLSGKASSWSDYSELI